VFDLSPERLKRTRAAQVARRLVRRGTEMPQPVLSVVVPFHDSTSRFDRCLDSLAAQTLSDVEIVLVDDGSTDGSTETAQRFVDCHPGLRHLVRQAHAGVAAARNMGVHRASGKFLAFCDSDDEVPVAGYERLVSSLQQSGSDFAVGSVSMEKKGIYQEPRWARRSNADRRLAVELDDFPEAVANLLPGTRVFRRSFWDAQQLSFAENSDHSDIITIVQSMLAARTFDIIPTVVYRWGWREDGRSLLQQGLRDKDRAADMVANIVKAGDLVVAGGSEALQERFFADILHTTTPDLVRAAVCRNDGYWEALSGQMRVLLDGISKTTLQYVPVEDRIVAWLCARDERRAAEEFLEYAFDNVGGYPRRQVGGRAHIALPFIDAISAAGDELTRVADSDMSYRTRLTEMAWKSPGILAIRGAAFVEYVDDSVDPGTVTLLLRNVKSGQEVTVPARRTDSAAVNRWANRTHEDHSRAEFEAEINVGSLPRPEGSRVTFDVLVRLDLHGTVHVAPFQSRRGAGSAGLLEVSAHGGVSAVPRWRGPLGLGLLVRNSQDADLAAAEPSSPVVVHDLAGADHLLTIAGRMADDCELALVGPRSRTPWVRVERSGQDGFTAQLSVLVDEWGLGTTSLPIDDYDVVARLADQVPFRVTVDVGLWRRLPVFFDSGTHLYHPRVGHAGALSVRVTPGEFRDSVGAFVRRRLRDETYPAARDKPLLDAVVFETFGGRAAGDNPGPICEELVRREAGLDLVFSVLDGSVAVPSGARSVIRWSREWFELLARARYLVTNAPLPTFFRKRPDQVFLHTWHGTPLKRIGHDRRHLDFTNWHHRRQLLMARESWDYLLSQSPFCTKALRSAFMYEGTMLEVGYPRNDILSSPDADDVRRRTREHFGLSEGTRVILYAPTWRDNHRAGQVFHKMLYLDPTAVVRQVPNSVLLIRGHYNSMGAADENDPDPRILDVTRYPDISHLYLAADALITDYSSVYFDFAMTDKPMYFLAPDLVQYRDENRGFYLDYHETVPGPVGITSQDVVDALNGPDDYAEVRERFRAEFTPLDDGRASQRVADALLGIGADEPRS
jgi:CDP-glycerol glycerophosphotransferase (TagB/SpsB family)